MTSHEATRVKERLEDKSKETLIRNLGPRQQGVFLKVCTDNMRTPPLYCVLDKNLRTYN
jgi:hypothetical protein